MCCVQVRYSTRAPQWQLTGGNLTVNYYLGEMVLRLGSKHLMGGLSFPLEAQLIHYNSKYNNLQEALSEPDGVVVVVKFFQVSSQLLFIFYVRVRASGHVHKYCHPTPLMLM